MRTKNTCLAFIISMRRAAKELYLNIKLQLNCPALQTTVSPKWLMCIRILKTYVLVSSSFVLVSVYPTFFCLRTRRKWNLPEEYFTSRVNSSYRILLSITQSSSLKLPTKNDIINYTALLFVSLGLHFPRLHFSCNSMITLYVPHSENWDNNCIFIPSYFWIFGWKILC